MPTSPNSVVSRRRSALSGLLLGLLSTAATAVPLHYDESVSGDLSAAPTSAFLFDVGANTITGNTFFFVLEPGCSHFCFDADSFAFVLPERVLLVDVSLSFTLTADNVSRATTEYLLCAGLHGDDGSCFASLLGEQTVSYLDGSPVAVDFGAALPLAGASSYTILSHGLGIAPIDSTLPEGWSADYTWTFRVEAVPIPASLPLMLTALLGVALRSRKEAPLCGSPPASTIRRRLLGARGRR